MKISAIITRPFFDTLKIIVYTVFFIASMIAGSKTFAQHEDAPKDINESPAVNQHGGQNDDDPMGKKPGTFNDIKNESELMAEDMSKLLAERLNLTDDQKTKLYSAVLDYASSHDRSTFSHNELDNMIEALLTSEQKNNYREYLRTAPERNTPVHYQINENAKPVN